MSILVKASITLALIGLPAQAVAQVTQTYQYDANGRLTGVTTSGSAGTNTAAYAYDDADNRTSRSQTGSSAYAALFSLPTDETLLPGQALVSRDSRYSLALRSSGQLELWENQAPVDGAVPLGEIFNWSGKTGSTFKVTLTRPAVLRLTDDGELIADAENAILWRLSSLDTAGDSQ